MEEAKRRVYADPASNRSWNLCWLVLRKIEDEYVVSSTEWAMLVHEADGYSGLIGHYARYEAALPVMWGGRVPEEGQVVQLVEVLVREWQGALRQLLRYWEVPPTH